MIRAGPAGHSPWRRISNPCAVTIWRSAVRSARAAATGWSVAGTARATRESVAARCSTRAGTGSVAGRAGGAKAGRADDSKGEGDMQRPRSEGRNSVGHDERGEALRRAWRTSQRLAAIV
jgi:hypothetical protein